MKTLKEFEQEFHDILERNDLEQERKDIQLSALMIEMEREFKIPRFKSDKYKKENREVVDLYQRIATSRKLDE